MLQSQVEELVTKLHLLTLRDREFANSLIRSYNNKGSLTPKQTPWIQNLIARADGTAKPTTPRKTEQVGALDGLIALFAKAGEHLKHPAINLLVNNYPVRLYMGRSGAGAGSVNVTDGGRYGNNKWYGRVSADGTWTHGRAFPEAGEVRQLLKDMSANPAATAQAHGKLTGKCCFCNNGLKDEKSTSVGYGPVCADHFGLPWGNKRRGQ